MSLVFGAGSPCTADLIRDGSIGPDQSVQPQLGTDDTWRITEDFGTRGGQSLFHSFSEFVLDAGLTAEFSSDPTLVIPERLIIRETSPQRSEVRGNFVSTIPGADVFFLDEQGVFVSSTGRFDAQGSIFLSMANELRFDDGPDYDFVTGDATPGPMLSAAAPTEFGFLELDPTAPGLNINQRQATVNPDQTFALVGSRVLVSFPTSRAEPSGETIRAPGANVVIVSLGAPADVPIELPDLRNFEPPPGDPSDMMGTLLISGGARVDVGSNDTGQPAGQILIRAEQFVLEGSLASEHQTAGLGGGIDIVASDSIVVRPHDPVGSAAPITSTIVTSASAGEGGDILIEATRIEISGAEIASTSEGTGAGGYIELSAIETLEILDEGLIRSEARGVIEGGAVEIRAGTLRVADEDGNGARGPQISSLTISPEVGGVGGSIGIEADSLLLEGGGKIFTQAGLAGQSETAAKAGSLRIEDAGQVRVSGMGRFAGQDLRSAISTIATEATLENSGSGLLQIVGAGTVEVLDGGLISSTTAGPADSAGLRIEAEGVRVEGGQQFGRARIETSASASGAGGSLEIVADRLELLNGGQLNASSRNSPAGAIEVRARLVDVSGVDPLRGEEAAIFSILNSGGSGAGGTILLSNAESVRVADGGVIDARTEGTGRGGDVAVQARTIEVAGPGSRISASGVGNLVGGAGDVKLVGSESVLVANGALVESRNTGSGDAGLVRIEAGRRLDVVSGSISASARQASGGDVELAAGDRFYAFDATITGEVDLLSGDGGNVSIGSELVALDRSLVKASASAGNGGNVLVRGEAIMISNTIFDVTSRTGLAGTLEFEGPNAELAGDLATLPTEFVDASALVQTACESRTERQGSFVVETRSIDLEPPDGSLQSTTVESGCIPTEEGP